MRSQNIYVHYETPFYKYRCDIYVASALLHLYISIFNLGSGLTPLKTEAEKIQAVDDILWVQTNSTPKFRSNPSNNLGGSANRQKDHPTHPHNTRTGWVLSYEIPWLAKTIPSSESSEIKKICGRSWKTNIHIAIHRPWSCFCISSPPSPPVSLTFHPYSSPACLLWWTVSERRMRRYPIYNTATYEYYWTFVGNFTSNG